MEPPTQGAEEVKLDRGGIAQPIVGAPEVHKQVLYGILRLVFLPRQPEAVLIEDGKVTVVQLGKGLLIAPAEGRPEQIVRYIRGSWLHAF